MRKIFSSIFTLVFLGSLLNVQAADRDDFQFGIRMGAQLSTIDGNFVVPSALGVIAAVLDDKNKTPLVGPAFGFIFEIPVHANIEIRPEVNFGSQGRRYKDKDMVYSQWLGAVQVPILLRGQVGSDKVRGFAHIGPQFGANVFLLDRLKNGDDIKDKNSYSMKDVDLKTFDAGMTFGAGVEFPSTAGMEIEVRYYLGLTDINNSKVLKGETKNRSLHLTLAFKF